MRKDKGLSPEAIDELLGMMRQIDVIDLSKLEEEIKEKRSTLDKAAEAMEKMDFKRHPPKKKKLHWKAKKRKEREYNKNVRRPRRAKARAELLRKGGWYGILRMDWEKRGVSWEISPEDWETHVGSLDSCVPMVTRYDAALGISLTNVLIRDRDSLKVVFDGKEYELRKMGYII